MPPSLASEFTAPVLMVTPGLAGFRVAYVGGPDFDVLAEFRTADEAQTARREALGMTAVLLATVFGVGGLRERRAA